jgi:hypothetical protein
MQSDYLPTEMTRPQYQCTRGTGFLHLVLVEESWSKSRKARIIFINKRV